MMENRQALPWIFGHIEHANYCVSIVSIMASGLHGAYYHFDVDHTED